MTQSASSRHLFEQTPVFKAVARLAFPTVIGQIILVVYNICDTFFVGLTGSDAMLTAVTVCMPLYMILTAISNLFGVGSSSVISRAMGEKKTDTAGDASRLAFWGCMLLTLLYSAGIWIFMDPVLDLLGGTHPEVHEYAKSYLLITVVIGGIPTAFNALLAHLLRSEGKALHASFGVALGGILNIVLDPLLMFVILPKGQEIAGAALATTLSNVIADIYFCLICYRRRKRTILRFSLPKSIEGTLLKDLLLTGLPACLMTLMENISYGILEKLMAAYGMAFQAGLGVAKKINMLAHCVVRGMSQGVLPLIGYNYSAKKYQRMKSAVLCSSGLSVAISIFLLIVNLLFSTTFISIFIHAESESLASGALFLRILCIGGPFSAFAYSIISFFQATGKSMKSFVLAIMRKGILDIPLMFLLDTWLPRKGIVMATPIADALCCIAAIVLFMSFIRSLGTDQAQASAARNE